MTLILPGERPADALSRTPEYEQRAGWQADYRQRQMAEAARRYRARQRGEA